MTTMTAKRKTQDTPSISLTQWEIEVLSQGLRMLRGSAIATGNNAQSFNYLVTTIDFAKTVTCSQ